MRFEKLDLNLLVALDAILKYKSVSLAAKELHLTQPALSNALNRLREYFDDELLIINSGKSPILTERALSLEAPVREALLLVKNSITIDTEFDPLTARRHFNLVSSDYTLQTYLSSAISEISELAPELTFDVIALDESTFEMLDKGEADLLFIIENYKNRQHPSEKLFSDEHCVICWNKANYKKSISKNDYLAAKHNTVIFGAQRRADFAELFFEFEGVERSIRLRVPNYSALPKSIIGTDHIATVPIRLARQWVETLPLRILPSPYKIPLLTQSVQWHRLRDKDNALNWVIEVFKQHAKNLNNPVKS